MSFDAHTHLDDPAFDLDRDAVLARAAAAGVTGFFLAGADPARWDGVRELALRLGQPWSLGIHPWWEPDTDVDAALARLAAVPDLPAVGEIGLDHRAAATPEARARQVQTLRAQLALARERGMPIVLHIVRAGPEALRVLRADGVPAAGGLVHGCSLHADLVPAYLALGLQLSFGAAITRSPRAAEAMRRVPDDRLLLETDCPDQPLHPGSRGEPADLPAIVAAAAAIRGCPVVARRPW